MGRARGTLLLLGACLCAVPAFAQAPQAPQAPPQRHPYAAIHSLALTVKDVAKASAKVEKALAAAGGVSTVGRENRVGSDKVGYAQWSTAVPAGALEKLLKRLRKLGKVTRDVRQANLPADGPGEARTDKVLLNIALEGPPVPEKT